jgi:hypothetical protein
VAGAVCDATSVCEVDGVCAGDLGCAGDRGADCPLNELIEPATSTLAATASPKERCTWRDSHDLSDQFKCEIGIPEGNIDHHN